MKAILITFLTICLWLMISSATSALEAVLDTDGNPLRRSRTAEYYVRPAASESGGPFTPLSRTEGGAGQPACPLYVGQRNVTSDDVTPVRFSPHDSAEETVYLGRNFMVAFSGGGAGEPCGPGPLTWSVAGPYDPPNRRAIAATSGGGSGGFSSYFLISKFQNFDNIYVFEWCPAELCPVCRFACGSVGLEFVNGKRFFALDGNGTGFPFTNAFPVVFERVYYNTNLDNNYNNNEGVE